MYIPSAVSLREIKVLQRYAKDKTVVEIGSLLGYSTIHLANCAKEVTSIDWHKGYPSLPNDTFRCFLRNINTAGVAGRVRTIRACMCSTAAIRAGFTFIDLDGTAETTEIAISKALSPFIGVHDFERSQCGGVGLAIKRSGLEVVERVDSLVILAR